MFVLVEFKHNLGSQMKSSLAKSSSKPKRCPKCVAESGYRWAPAIVQGTPCHLDYKFPLTIQEDDDEVAQDQVASMLDSPALAFGTLSRKFFISEEDSTKLHQLPWAERAAGSRDVETLKEHRRRVFRQDECFVLDASRTVRWDFYEKTLAKLNGSSTSHVRVFHSVISGCTPHFPTLFETLKTFIDLTHLEIVVHENDPENALDDLLTFVIGMNPLLSLTVHSCTYSSSTGNYLSLVIKAHAATLETLVLDVARDAVTEDVIYAIGDCKNLVAVHIRNGVELFGYHRASTKHEANMVSALPALTCFSYNDGNEISGVWDLREAILEKSRVRPWEYLDMNPFTTGRMIPRFLVEETAFLLGVRTKFFSLGSQWFTKAQHVRAVDANRDIEFVSTEASFLHCSGATVPSSLATRYAEYRASRTRLMLFYNAVGNLCRCPARRLLMHDGDNAIMTRVQEFLCDFSPFFELTHQEIQDAERGDEDGAVAVIDGAGAGADLVDYAEVQ